MSERQPWWKRVKGRLDALDAWADRPLGEIGRDIGAGVRSVGRGIRDIFKGSQVRTPSRRTNLLNSQWSRPTPKLHPLDPFNWSLFDNLPDNAGDNLSQSRRSLSRLIERRPSSMRPILPSRQPMLKRFVRNQAPPLPRMASPNIEAASTVNLPTRTPREIKIESSKFNVRRNALGHPLPGISRAIDRANANKNEYGEFFAPNKNQKTRKGSHKFNRPREIGIYNYPDSTRLSSAPIATREIGSSSRRIVMGGIPDPKGVLLHPDYQNATNVKAGARLTPGLEWDDLLSEKKGVVKPTLDLQSRPSAQPSRLGKFARARFEAEQAQDRARSRLQPGVEPPPIGLNKVRLLSAKNIAPFYLDHPELYPEIETMPPGMKRAAMEANELRAKGGDPFNSDIRNHVNYPQYNAVDPQRAAEIRSQKTVPPVATRQFQHVAPTMDLPALNVTKELPNIALGATVEMPTAKMLGTVLASNASASSPTVRMSGDLSSPTVRMRSPALASTGANPAWSSKRRHRASMKVGRKIKIMNRLSKRMQPNTSWLQGGARRMSAIGKSPLTGLLPIIAGGIALGIGTSLYNSIENTDPYTGEMAAKLYGMSTTPAAPLAGAAVGAIGGALAGGSMTGGWRGIAGGAVLGGIVGGIAGNLLGSVGLMGMSALANRDRTSDLRGGDYINSQGNAGQVDGVMSFNSGGQTMRGYDLGAKGELGLALGRLGKRR